MLKETREMFIFGYDSYMKYAFPLDELDPIHCTGKLTSKYTRDWDFLSGHSVLAFDKTNTIISSEVC